MEGDSVSATNVCEITQCSICLGTFKVPKALPCIHTFCLQCLDSYCEEKEQEEMACPLCKKVFTIPPGGNINLPNNFFIIQLLEAKQSNSAAVKEDNYKQRLCELCSNSEFEIPSTSYCIECDQHICDKCAEGHKKFKLFKTHQVVRDDDISSTKEKLRMSASYCEQHPAEQNRLYCHDCKMVTCLLCSVDKHKKHELIDVNVSAENFREQLKDDIDNVSECALKKLEHIKQLEIDASLFLEKLTTAQKEISQKCDQLISLIQSQKNQLMEELNEFKVKVLKEVETEKKEVESQFGITESFKRYCQEMMNKGTACHISRTALDLHARAEELVNTPDLPSWHKLNGVEITFKPSLVAMDTAVNLIGELVCRS